ncbi:AmmeMemoRadiSam system radical SAM enzyme [Candidatus Pacearchaeota archaeon]|nr:AmmeMemoRadiSam system radical SAM enzyme [Candidatus Pacearchaeota archaeon]
MKKECKLYKQEKDKVRCLACAHKCLINKGETGICGVRKNIENELILLVYGKVVSMAVDPIEKKPLYKFLPGTDIFSIGTVGCNFRCDFCQNYDISQASKAGFILGEEIKPEEIVKKAISSGCNSIAYTYNEPAIFIEFVYDIAKLAKEKGLRNVLVTNGYMSEEAFEYVKEYIDAVNIDLKGNDLFYQKLCGAKLNPVLDTIRRFSKAGKHVEVTTLLIPEENDDDKEIEDIAKFIASVDKNIVWHISRFFPRYKMLDKDITGKKSLKKAYEIGRKYLNHVYLGNV